MALGKDKMEFKKKAYYLLQDWMPPRLFPRSVSILVILEELFSKNLIDKKEIRKLKSSASGDAFLLATGPSLRNIDVSFLFGKDCFSVSNFFLHEEIAKIAPKMHFFAPYHEPLILDEFVLWMKNADKALPPSTEIVLGDKTRTLIQKNKLFEGRTVHYLKLRKAMGGGKPDLTRPILAPYTSPLMVLPVLYYMGYDRVFLLGCDHNTIKDYRKTIENFYDPAKDVRTNATSGKKWDQGIIYTLEEALRVFQQYRQYADIYAAAGKSLFNMSVSSWLDFIPYCSINEYCKARDCPPPTKPSDRP